MLNFSFTVLITFILIYSNIIILNEETLIFVCFVFFILIVLNKFSQSVHNNLSTQSSKLEKLVTESLNSLLSKILFTIQLQKSFENFSTSFKKLGDHFIKLGYAFINKLPDFIIQKIEVAYPKRFLYIQRFESQATKLLVLLLIKKLHKTTSIQKFYTNELKVTNFVCMNKIIFREYFKII